MSREIERRPLVLALLGLIIGLTAVSHPEVLLGLAVLALVRSVRAWAVVGGGLLLGGLLSPKPVEPVLVPAFVEGDLKVASVPRLIGAQSFATCTLHGQNLRATFPAGTDVHWGDVWRVKGVARPLQETSAPFLLSEGVQGDLRLSSSDRVSSGPAIVALADAWPRSFSRFSHSVLSSEDADWVDAVCFRNGNLPREDRSDLELAGSGYLVAASGLHVYVLAALVFAASALLRFPRPVRVGLTLSVLALYCLATGFHATTVRASVSCVLFIGAYLFAREPDSLSALTAAGIGYLLFCPLAVYNLGFQLTATVCAALALYLPKMRHHGEGFIGSIKENAVLSAWAAAIIILAGQPLVSLSSGHLSLGAIPANLLTAVVAPVGLGLCFLAQGAWWISHPLGAGLLEVAASLVTYLRVVSHWVAGADWSVGVPEFSAYLLAPYYGLWLLVWRPRAIPA